MCIILHNIDPRHKEVQEGDLEHYLPTGTGVRVHYRQIPAGPLSSIRSQATIVMRTQEQEQEDDDSLPNEFTDSISSFEERNEFVEELDELYDIFKTIKYPDIDFQHGLDYRERMSRLEEDSEDADPWDEEQDDEDDEDDEDEMKTSKCDSVKAEKSLLRPIPDEVGTVGPDVRFYDEARLCLLNREPQSVLSNCVGWVDQVLTDHLAILSFLHQDKKIKVLCSSEDTFCLDITEKFDHFKDFKANNELRFEDAAQVWMMMMMMLMLMMMIMMMTGVESERQEAAPVPVLSAQPRTADCVQRRGPGVQHRE